MKTLPLIILNKHLQQNCKSTYINLYTKKINLIVSIIVFSFFLCSFLLVCNNQKVYANTTYYARITNDNTHLYIAPEEIPNNTIFILPKTYFVELISSSDNFFYAKYKDIYGYVKKNEVQVVSTNPITPFLSNISFRVFTPSGANLRSTPQNLGSTNLVYSIPFLETNLEYYGEILGEEAISKKGCTWYYCKYFINNLSYMGYLYAPLCDLLPSLPKNTEIIEPYTGELFLDEEQTLPTTTSPMEQLSPTAQSIIIVAVSLPCLLFIYLLFKPTHMAESAKQTNSKKNSHKKISRLKRSDYFELDDDFS